MFWFTNETLKRLSNYPRKMSQEEKVMLQDEWMASFYGTGQPLTFNNDIALIDNNEVIFIQALLHASCNPNKVLNEINNILKCSELKFEDEKIVNEQGSCSYVWIERIGGRNFIRKKAKEHDIQLEYRILNDIWGYKSPYVISLEKSSLFDGSSYLMEFAEDSLEKYVLGNRANINKKETIERVVNIVSFLHENNILHRDLHPGNFLFIEKNNIQTLKIADFGCARFLNDAEKIDDTIIKHYGRNDYVAPEQHENFHKAGIASDIFSVGKLINFIQTGSPKKSNHELQKIANNCTWNKPESRYQSMAELKKDLYEYFQMGKQMSDISSS